MAYERTDLMKTSRFQASLTATHVRRSRGLTAPHARIRTEFDAAISTARGAVGRQKSLRPDQINFCPPTAH
jgi:hypothetical protein